MLHIWRDLALILGTAPTCSLIEGRTVLQAEVSSADAAADTAAALERKEMAERAMAAEAAAVAELRATVTAAQAARIDDARRADQVHLRDCHPPTLQLCRTLLVLPAVHPPAAS